MKKIDFVGKTWEVPSWARYITQDLDSSGAVNVWEKAPVFCYAYWTHSADDWLNPGKAKCLGYADVLAPVRAI